MKSTEEILLMIDLAFSERKALDLFLYKNALQGEHLDIQDTLSASWRDFDLSLLKSIYPIFFDLTPEGFCFLIPSIMSVSIKSQCFDFLVLDGFLSLLDRSPIPDYWDAFFIQRFSLLNNEELDAIAEWLVWLSSNREFLLQYGSGQLERAFDTIFLLKTLSN